MERIESEKIEIKKRQQWNQPQIKVLRIKLHTGTGTVGYPVEAYVREEFEASYPPS
jgi:hypothetical protein